MAKAEMTVRVIFDRGSDAYLVNLIHQLKRENTGLRHELASLEIFMQERGLGGHDDPNFATLAGRVWSYVLQLEEATVPRTEAGARVAKDAHIHASYSRVGTDRVDLQKVGIEPCVPRCVGCRACRVVDAHPDALYMGPCLPQCSGCAACMGF